MAQEVPTHQKRKREEDEMKLEIFDGLGNKREQESEINKWFEEQRPKVIHVTQSECGSGASYSRTICVWYEPTKL